MRSGIMLAAMLGIVGFGAENVNYDKAKQGQLPTGWSAPAGHKWSVRPDKTAPSKPNVMRGTSVETESPLALFDSVVCLDGDLSVKFRIETPRPGQHGNGAGIVWRYRDPGNYYLLSLSADEKNIVLQHVKNGVAEVLPTTGGKRVGNGVAEDIRAGQWHVVKVIFRGPKIQVFFGNRSLFTAQDDGGQVPGKTGLWAKGPNGADFDDFRIDKKG